MIAQPSAPIVLADIPERVRLRQLQAELEQRRDQIASLELELQVLRDELLGFELQYQARLAVESAALSRLQGIIRHLERWAELLREELAGEQLQARVKRIEQKRAREVERLREEQPTLEANEPEAKPADTAEEMKAFYRRLARRYHPDLAATEEERVRNGGLMARINELYRMGDIEALRLMAEQAQGGEVDTPPENLDAHIALLEERLAWFNAVMENLKEERAALERSPTCALWRSVQQAQEVGRDLYEELRQEMRGRVEHAYDEIRAAVRALEGEVNEFNRKSTGLVPPPGRRASALERLFDPYADKRLIRLGLQDLENLQVGPEARRQAAWLEELAGSRPPLLRLVLLTYACELSPFPLPGLEKYEDLALRFGHLSREDAPPSPSLEEALGEAADILEFGVRRMTERLVHLGLRFRSDAMREAVPLALRAHPVRTQLRRVLGVLGERARCARCDREVFAVPLFKTRGLDDLRAIVCPDCGETLKSYFMPSGKDVQAVLNDAFLDLEVISEWSLRMARASVALQLTPRQVDMMTVGQLKQRFHKDVLERHELGLTLKQVELAQRGKRIPSSRPLADLDETAFSVQFSKDAPVSVADALEMIRHRVRNRFRATPG